MLLGVLYLPRAADADFAYAFSRDHVIGFTITGGTMTRDVSLTLNTAEFQGFGRDLTQDPADAKQAKSGPGPFPGENDDTPQGRVGQYARADSVQLGLALSSRNWAEAHRTSRGSADATASVSFGFDLRQDSDDPIKFAFSAFPLMRVATGGPGDFSSAGILFRFSLFDPVTFVEFLRWEPVGDVLRSFTRNGGVVTDVLDPFSLNTSIACEGACDRSYSPAAPHDFTLSYKRTTGQRYRANFLMAEIVSVRVPEPHTVSLVGLGILGLLGFLWRRQRTTSDPACVYGRSTEVVLFMAVLSSVLGTTRPANADLIAVPPHSHAPSPVTTFMDGHVPIAIHQHQHRTGHDPRAGIHDHGGAGAYVTPPPAQAPRVWVGRHLVATGGAGHPFANEFAHGHQGHELPAGRYHVHAAVAGGDITAAEALAWNTGAAIDVAGALNGFGPTGLGWLDVGNAAGPRNWPGVEGPGHGADPAGGGLPAPGTGGPWHSSVAWDSVLDATPHEVHITYGEGGGSNPAMDNFLAITQLAAFGHAAPGAGAVTIVMDDDQSWFYGGVGAVPAGEFDFASVMLHEWGHVLGLGHFGTIAAGYIMADPFLGPGQFLRTIDPDAIHGIRDLYAIAVSGPWTLALVATGALSLLGRAWRRRNP